MRTYLFWGLCLLMGALGFAPQPTLAQTAPALGDRHLVLLFSPMNKPPFWYFEAGQPKGIVYDLLQEVSQTQGIQLQAQAASRKRGASQVLANRHFVVSRALEWIERPERFAISTPLINNPDILISRLDDPVDFEHSPKELAGMIVGTHIGYVYPRLDPLFHNSLLIRSDSSDELNILQRVYQKRTRTAVISRPVARWYIKRNHWQPRFYLSQQVLSDVELRLLFNKAQSDFADAFDRELERMRRDGRYQAIIDQYL